MNITDKSNISRIKFIELIDALELPKEKTIIIGSALLVAMDYIEENNDLDVIVPVDTFIKLKSNPLLHFKIKDGIEILSNDTANLEIIFKFVPPVYWTFEDIENQTITIDGYKFMNPMFMLDFYYQINRPKDKIKIKLLKHIIDFF